MLDVSTDSFDSRFDNVDNSFEGYVVSTIRSLRSLLDHLETAPNPAKLNPSTATTTVELSGSDPNEGVGEHHRDQPPTDTTPIENTAVADQPQFGFDKLNRRW